MRSFCGGEMRNLFAFAVSFVLCTAAPAVTIGQIDVFTTGTENWIAPDPTNPNPPTTALGGPGGAADPYLQLIASGNPGPGGKLTVLNGAQWTGDFLAAGIARSRWT